MANDFSGDANCVALYRFESGALTTDSKGTNTLTSNGTPVSDTTNYKEGSGSVDFEASDTGDYFSRADADLSSDFPFKSGTSNTTFSFVFWYKAETLSGAVVSKYSATSGGRSLEIRPATSIDLLLGYNSGNSVETISHASALSTGRWYHVGVAVDGATGNYRIRIWDDTAGAILGTDKTGTAANALYLNTRVFAIGSRAGSPWLDGLLDEVAVFNDVLSATEIDAIRAGTYAAGSTPVTITVAAASLLWTGQTVTGNARTLLPIAQGALAWAGQAVKGSEALKPAAASWKWTGQGVTAGGGSFVEVAKATLQWSGKALKVSETIRAATAIWNWTGQGVRVIAAGGSRFLGMIGTRFRTLLGG